MRKRDAIVLLLICGFVLLNAGALHMGGSLRAKTLMCQTNLQCIGQALNLYVEDYDGHLPLLGKGSNDYKKNFYNLQYYVLKKAVADQEPNPAQYKWINMGCLFGAGLIGDGRTFYCPATSGGLDEYLTYGSTKPWGVLPQYLPSGIPIPPNTTNQWLRTKKGYVYWPQSKDLATAADVALYIGNNPSPGNFWLYQEGYPKPATVLADLDQDRVIVVDVVLYAGEQYKVNALFWDGSVVYQDTPTGTDGKKLYYDSNPDPVSPGSNWRRASMAEWMAALHR